MTQCHVLLSAASPRATDRSAWSRLGQMRYEDCCLCICLLLCSTKCCSQHHGHGRVHGTAKAGHAVKMLMVARLRR